jgi:hypothetical protein
LDWTKVGRWIGFGGIALVVEAAIAMTALSNGPIRSNHPAQAPVAALATGTPSVSQHAKAAPSARAWAAAAFYPPASQLLLFGGMTGFNPGNPAISGETWNWDGRAWQQLHPVNSPPARYDAGLVYDPVDRVLVMFGGTDGQQGFQDTWTWDGVNWKQMSPQQSPPAWPMVTMTYDSTRKTALLYLGGQPCPCDSLDQTWSWNGTTWTQLQTDTTPNPNHGQQMSGIVGSIVFDAASGRTLYVGSTGTWNLADSGWVHVGGGGTPVNTDTSGWPEFVVAYDDSKRGVVEIGAHGDTWVWDGSGWTVQNSSAIPPPRTDEALAFDPVHHQLVLFGGAQHFNGPPEWTADGDTWLWDGATWKQAA